MAIFASINKNERYITLREASQISGYSADYVGQLIRKGKISGKQIYSNPVWVAREQDVLNYLNENKNKDRAKESENDFSNRLRSFVTRLRSEIEIVKLYKGILYFTIGISVIFSLSLFYVFSVSLDSWLDSRSSVERVIPASTEF